LRLPLRSALDKLGFALPPAQRQVIAYARQRLHVDPTPFFDAGERAPALEVLREAVWQNRRARVAYVDFDGKRSRRTIDPLGLVVKAARWYLVAATRRGVRVFRAARIEHVSLLDATFERPADFDLPRFWRDWGARFAEQRASFPVELRLDEASAEALRAMRPEAERERIRAGACTLDFERERIAVGQLCGLPGRAEVVAPACLRARLRAIGAALRATYGP